MSVTIRDVYQWHIESVQECAHNVSTREMAQLHAEFAKALRPYLPPLLCPICRGSGFQEVTDSDSCEVIPCRCGA